MPSPLLPRYLAALNLLIKTCKEWDCIITHRPATPSELDDLGRLGIRDPVLSLMAAAVLTDTADFNLRIKNPDGIVYENTMLCPGDEICPLGFPVIGSTHCGDVYALDYHSPPGPDGTPRVLLVSHEHGYSAADEVAKSLEVAASFIEFIERAAAKEYEH